MENRALPAYIPPSTEYKLAYEKMVAEMEKISSVPAISMKPDRRSGVRAMFDSYLYAFPYSTTEQE